MALSDYKGPANSTEMMQYLVGDRIAAAFKDYSGDGHSQVVLVMGSGKAFVLNSNGAFWVESFAETERRVAKRRDQVNMHLAELGRLNLGIPELSSL